MLNKNFFLYIGRLVAYKQIEMIVEVFNDLKWPLKIIGTGKLESILQQKAKDNITFLGNLSDAEVGRHLRTSRGLIYFHEEDFGIVPVEAMAAGVPVIGLSRGGVTETVIHGQTGYLGTDLKSALLEFVKLKFDSQLIQDHARTFSKNRFKREFMDIISKL